MKLFLDTDILIDHLAQRQPYARHVRTLCIASYFGDVELWVSVQSYLDALYCLRSYASQRKLRDAAIGTLEFFKPCGMQAHDLQEALRSAWPDAEDFMIARGAVNVAADYMVTRDAKGFEGSPVTVISPEKAVELLESEGLNYSECDI